MQSNVKNVIFTWGKTNFRLFLVIGQSNGPLQEKKNHQTFVIWDDL